MVQQDALASGQNKNIHCPHCGTRNRDGEYSCSRCGERLLRPDPNLPPPMGVVACQKCETSNMARASYCVSCGASLETPLRMSPSAASSRTPILPREARDQARPREEPRAQQPELRRSQQQVEPRRPARAPEVSSEPNDSGAPAAQLPPALRRFNWAAFLLGPVWGLGNGVWQAILIGLAGAVVPWFSRSAPWVGFVALVVTLFIIGMKGNEWAWRARRWRSVEQFKRVQQGWLLWAVVIAVITLIVLSYFVRTGAEA